MEGEKAKGGSVEREGSGKKEKRKDGWRKGVQKGKGNN